MTSWASTTTMAQMGWTRSSGAVIPVALTEPGPTPKCLRSTTMV